MNSDGDRLKAEQNAIKLCKYLINTVNSLVEFPECMKQHYNWSGKFCPQILRRENRWDDFVSQIEQKEEKELISWEREAGIEALNNLVKKGYINSPDYHIPNAEYSWLLFTFVDKLSDEIDKINKKFDDIKKILEDK
jgi:hypothetical protein